MSSVAAEVASKNVVAAEAASTKTEVVVVVSKRNTREVLALMNEVAADSKEEGEDSEEEEVDLTVTDLSTKRINPGRSEEESEARVKDEAMAISATKAPKNSRSLSPDSTQTRQAYAEVVGLTVAVSEEATRFQETSSNSDMEDQTTILSSGQLKNELSKTLSQVDLGNKEMVTMAQFAPVAVVAWPEAATKTKIAMLITKDSTARVRSTSPMSVHEVTMLDKSATSINPMKVGKISARRLQSLSAVEANTEEEEADQKEAATKVCAAAAVATCRCADVDVVSFLTEVECEASSEAALEVVSRSSRIRKTTTTMVLATNTTKGRITTIERKPEPLTIMSEAYNCKSESATRGTAVTIK